MFNISKEKIRINIIPTIMFISSMIIALSNSEYVRKIIFYIELFLLGMQVQIIINTIKNKERSVPKWK